MNITLLKLISLFTAIAICFSTRPAEAETLPQNTQQSSYIINNVRIIDGDGDRGRHNVLIHGETIAAIDPTDVPKDIQQYDGTGKSLLPGLIDSHVHITMIPGEPFRKDSAEQRLKRHALDLRSYLAWGVTSIVDPGITPEDVAIINTISQTSPAPELFVIGPLLGPKHGYPSVVTKIHGLSTPEEIRYEIERFAQFNPLGVKVTMENGHYGDIWPLFSDEMMQSIETEAKNRGQPLYIHAMDAKMTRKALEMSPHALVHASKNGGKKLARELKAADVYVITTLDIYGSLLLLWNRDMLYPNANFTTPNEAIEMIFDKSIRKRTGKAFVEVNIPMLPVWISKWGFNQFFTKMAYRQAKKTMRIFNKEGVKLVLGSDSGGWPMLTHMLHGHTTHLEIDFLSQSGLSSQEIITAATKRPAKMLGLENEIGSIREGLRADLLIVEGNPLDNIQTLHSPVWVVRKGELRTPQNWMEE